MILLTVPIYFPIIEILTTVALASLIVAGARRVEINALTVGTVAAFLQLVRRFFDPLQDLSDKYNMLQQAMAASERIFKLLDTPAAPMTRAVAPVAITRQATSPKVTVEFHDVWFAYDIAHVARANVSEMPSIARSGTAPAADCERSSVQILSAQLRTPS